jgi:hypothetical protein
LTHGHVQLRPDAGADNQRHAVVAIPDNRWGERQLAFLVATPGRTVTAEDLRAHLGGLSCLIPSLLGRGADLLFQVLTERAAIVDRLTFGDNIIETGTDSCQLAPTRASTEQTTRTPA